MDKVGRLLKVARKTTKAILPGSMEAVYNLRRRLFSCTYFDPDGSVCAPGCAEGAELDPARHADPGMQAPGGRETGSIIDHGNPRNFLDTVSRLAVAVFFPNSSSRWVFDSVISLS